MNSSIEKQFVIIGAGLTGLTLAYYLKKQGKEVFLIEKANRTGGVINTVNLDGFVFETGPNTGVVGNPEVAELFEELKDLCQFEAANPESKRRLIWKKGKWHPLPSGLISAVTTPLFTFKDKFKVLGEPFRKKGDNPNETLAELVKRRLGNSFLDYAIDPFISGIYAGDTNYLIPKYALPKLYALEQNYGSFIKGSMQKAKEKKNNPRLQKATKKVFSAKGGLTNLVSALTATIGSGNILLNALNTSITPNNGSFIIDTKIDNKPVQIKAQKVISTVGGNELFSLLPFLTEKEKQPFEQLKYASIVQAIIGYKKWKGINLNAFGGLVPTVENKNILGALFTSSFFSNRAPKGGALISVFMGGTKRPDVFKMNDEEIHSTLKKDAEEMLGLSEFSPDFVKLFRYKFAIPQYGLSSAERFNTISGIQTKYPGLTIAGNIRNGIGMADRIKQSCDLAEELK